MYDTGQQSNDLEAPMWIVYLAIPLGSGLMCFRFLQVAWSFYWTGELPHHRREPRSKGSRPTLPIVDPTCDPADAKPGDEIRAIRAQPARPDPLLVPVADRGDLLRACHSA